VIVDVSWLLVASMNNYPSAFCVICAPCDIKILAFTFCTHSRHVHPTLRRDKAGFGRFEVFSLGFSLFFFLNSSAVSLPDSLVALALAAEADASDFAVADATAASSMGAVGLDAPGRLLTDADHQTAA
jgi:hypothetical protein